MVYSLVEQGKMADMQKKLAETEMQLEHTGDAQHHFEAALAIGEKLTQSNIMVAEWEAFLGVVDGRQEKLAEAVGVSRQSINSIERNRYIPSLPLALTFARVFGCSTDDIFALETEA